MWDKRYDVQEYVYGKKPNKFLEQKAQLIPSGRTLCLAEGEGRNAVYLAGLGHEVLAVDASAVGLEKARRLAEDNGVAISTVVADLADFVIDPGAFAGAISIFCHLPGDVRRRVHRRVVVGLEPGGILLLEAYTPAQLDLGTGGPRDPAMLMTLTDLEKELDGLEFIEAREFERDIVEGSLHSGRGAVVQIVGRKPD